MHPCHVGIQFLKGRTEAHHLLQSIQNIESVISSWNWLRAFRPVTSYPGRGPTRSWRLLVIPLPEGISISDSEQH